MFPISSASDARSHFAMTWRGSFCQAPWKEMSSIPLCWMLAIGSDMKDGSSDVSSVSDSQSSPQEFFRFVIENFRHWHLSEERETFSSRNQMKLTWSDVLWKLIWTFDGENCLTKKFKDFLSGFVCFSDDFVYCAKTTTRVVQCLM